MSAKVEMNRHPRRARKTDNAGQPERTWSIVILAGGQSSRMGRDKSRIVVGGSTLLQRVRAVAAATGLPIQTVRKDAVKRCGPLGGILTGLLRARTPWCLFLTCDMPAITRELLDEITARAERGGRPVFAGTNFGLGFPLALPVNARARVERAIAEGRLSVQFLAETLKADAFRPPAARQAELININTPAELRALRFRLRKSRDASCGSNL